MDCQDTVDLLVLGAGMAGSTAAARAAQGGASVALVDKAPAVGGSAAYAGYIWTAPSLEVMREVNPGGDPQLSARLVEDYDDAVEWVQSIGATVSDPVTILGFGRGRGTDMLALIRRCEHIVRERGGEVLLSAEPARLLLDDGGVRGADIVSASGERREIRARSTLLATGGFGGDPDLRARLIHPQARTMALRANSYSTGDGLRLGLEAGAAFGKPDAGFYGHLIPGGVAYEDPDEFTDLTFYLSEYGVLLNLAGARFCDEALGDHMNAVAVVRQPEARAVLVYDQRVHDRWMVPPELAGRPLDRFALARRRGARCAVAEDLEALADLSAAWGYPAPVVLRTLRDRAILATPPFYAIELVAAITFTFSGLMIDPQARVLDDRGDPIPGLLAAGADSGGVFAGGYAGGIANALIYGLQAARTALASAETPTGTADQIAV